MANKRVIAYTRVSSAKQATDDKSSHKYQEDRIREACKARGDTVVQVLKEIDRRWELDRPELTKARQAIRDGEADILMAMTMDRLSGDQHHVYIILEDVKRAGGLVQFADQQFEDTPEGRFLLNVYAFISEMEDLRIGRRVIQGQTGAINAGRPLGRIPLGFCKEGSGKDRKLAVDEATLPLIRRIFHNVADGVPTRQLLQRLEAEGRRTGLGGESWSSSGIIRIIRNPKYRGQHQGGLTKTERVKKVDKIVHIVHQRNEEDRGPVFFGPRLVSDELWEKANARLDRNKAESVRRNQSPETHLLRSGYAKCGLCGWNLNAKNPNDSRKPHYRCDNKLKNSCPGVTINQAELDREVWERVELVINSPGQALKKMVEQSRDGTLDARIAEVGTTAAKLTKRSDGLSKGIGKAYENEDEQLAADLVAQRKPLLAVLKEAEAELAGLRNQLQRQEELATLPSRLERMWHDVSDDFDNLGYEAKRNLLAELQVKAEVLPKLPGDTIRARTQITMRLNPEHLYGWDEEGGDWSFDPEEPVGEAITILQAGPTEEQRRRIELAQSKLTPEQRKANEDFLKLTPEERRSAAVKRESAPCCRRHHGRRCDHRGSSARTAAWSTTRAGRAAAHRNARRRGRSACPAPQAIRRRPSDARVFRAAASGDRPCAATPPPGPRTRGRRHSGR